MTLLIRRAGPADLRLVVDLRLAFLADIRGPDFVMLPEMSPQTERFVREEMGAGRMHSWLAEEDGRCVGIISMLLWARPPRPEDARTLNAYIINMFVVPHCRDRGTGRQLLNECLDSGDEFGISKFVLHTTDGGQVLYGAAGFSPFDATWLELSPELRQPIGEGRA